MALPVSPSYDDQALPQDLSRGAISGSQKPCRIIRMPSGREQRIKLWSGSKKRWTLPFDQRPLSQANTLIAFWEARDGGQRAFRFRDPAENSVTDQALAPDGSPYVQLSKTYSSGGQTRTKNIFAPVSAIVVKKNGVTITPALVSYTTGVVTLPVILQKVITAISQAASAVVTVGAAHGFAVNDLVYFSTVTGMTEINGRVGTVTATAATTITVNIDSSGFTAYAAGGLATKYLTTTDTLTWTGTHDYVARFDALMQEMVHDDAFIQSWSVPLLEVTQGSGEVETVAPIDPLSLPFAELYFRGDQAVGANGAGCASWPGLSLTIHDAAQATGGLQPIIRDGVSINGQRVLEWDGVNDQMSGVLTTLPATLAATNGYTVYCYVNELTIGTTGGPFDIQCLFSTGPTAINHFELVSRSGTAGGYATDQKYGMSTINVVRATFGTTQTGWQTVTGIWTPPSGPTAPFRCYVNGVQSGTDALDWSGVMGENFYLACNHTANVCFKGYVGAIVLFTTAHDTATRLGVEAYLRAFFEN